jgi:hypothetical protein
MPKDKAPLKAPSAKSKAGAKAESVPAQTAKAKAAASSKDAAPAPEVAKATETPVPSKPVKTPPAHHAGKPEQPLWARFNQSHSQKMTKGRSFRHQGR